MNRYVSTYRKDYTWPYVKSIGRKKGSAKAREKAPEICLCAVDPNERIPKQYGQPSSGETQEWSRLGPMGPLLEPKLYTAKTGPSPESEITKHDQPNIYMKKLQEKYPFLYGVLQSAKPDETIRVVDEDRMRTTYQTDYSTPYERFSTHRDELHAAAGVDGPHLQVCLNFQKPTDVSCRTHAVPPKCKAGQGSRSVSQRCGPKPEEPDEGRLPEWRSEYEDVISKLGEAIMKAKIHSAKRQVLPAWAAGF